jgi:hypothetical protein
MKGQSLEERIEAKLAKPNENGCRLWTGTVGAGGHGVIRKEGKLVPVKRAMWELHRGPIPFKVYVLPSCGNNLCAEPSHLYLSEMTNTSKLNLARGADRPPPLSDEVITTESGESKPLHEWLSDPRVKARRATIKTRLWMQKLAIEHNKRNADDPDFAAPFSRCNLHGHMPVWTTEEILFRPTRTKRG